MSDTPERIRRVFPPSMESVRYAHSPSDAHAAPSTRLNLVRRTTVPFFSFDASPSPGRASSFAVQRNSPSGDRANASSPRFLRLFRW